MTYAKTLQDQLNKIANTVYEPSETTVPGAIHTYGQIPGLNATLHTVLTSFAEKIAQSVREETIERCIKYMRSGEIAGSFSEGCDCKKCDIYEKKVRKSLTTLATLDK